METIHLNRSNLEKHKRNAKPCVIALGFFDGIHKGHREVIFAAAQIAKRKNLSLAVMSFFPHPKTVISNGKIQINYLMPMSEKEEILRQLGVDLFYTIDFNKEFASLLPEHFVVKYLVNLNVVHAVAGFDFTYGYKGYGNMDRLKNDSGGLIEVNKIKKIELHGEKISSTCIREKLLNGNVEEIPKFLGRAYQVECDWDGEAIKPHPYYTLPAPGKYEVTLHKRVVDIKAKIVVLRTTEGLSLKCMTKIPNFMKGKLSIIWHRRIPQDNVVSWGQWIPFRTFSYKRDHH